MTYILIWWIISTSVHGNMAISTSSAEFYGKSKCMIAGEILTSEVSARTRVEAKFICVLKNRD